MTAESPAALIRRAAERLREAAGAATPGPWVENVLGSEGYDVRGPEVPALPGSRVTRRPRVARCGYEQWEIDKANAAYIALVDPVVGAAVADWLDAVARRIGEIHESLPFSARLTLSSLNVTAAEQAFRVARSILRETGGE